MSRSRKRPWVKDSTGCNKYWKRQATRALRRFTDYVSNGKFYKKLYCSWTWCDYIFWGGEEPKNYRK